MRLAYSGFIFCVTVAMPALAQMPPSPAACARAATAVDGARLPDENDTTALWWYTLANCGKSGTAAAAKALRSSALRSETDPARVDEFVTLFYRVRSADLFAALQSTVLSDATSPVVKRAAIRAFGAQHTPIDFSAADFLRQAPPFCGIGPRVTEFVPSSDASALPADYLAQIIRTMRAVEADEGNARDVRGAAHCWRVTLETPPPPNPKNVELQHVCGYRFRVTNKNATHVIVTALVEGTTEKHSFIVSADSAFRFVVLRPGRVLLFMNDLQIGKKETVNTKCAQDERPDRSRDPQGD